MINEKFYKDQIYQLIEDHTKQLKDNYKLKEALEFYADERNWSWDMHVCCIYEDDISLMQEIDSIYRTCGGKRAREALK